MDGISGSPILWDLELGDLLLAGVAGRVGSDVGSSTLGMNMLPTSLLHMKVVEALNDLSGIDLCRLSAINSNGMRDLRRGRHGTEERGGLHGVRETSLTGLSTT